MKDGRKETADIEELAIPRRGEPRCQKKGEVSLNEVVPGRLTLGRNARREGVLKDQYRIRVRFLCLGLSCLSGGKGGTVARAILTGLKGFSNENEKRPGCFRKRDLPVFPEGVYGIINCTCPGGGRISRLPD